MKKVMILLIIGFTTFAGERVSMLNTLDVNQGFSCSTKSNGTRKVNSVILKRVGFDDISVTIKFEGEGNDFFALFNKNVESDFKVLIPNIVIENNSNRRLYEISTGRNGSVKSSTQAVFDLLNHVVAPQSKNLRGCIPVLGLVRKSKTIGEAISYIDHVNDSKRSSKGSIDLDKNSGQTQRNSNFAR